MQIGKRIIYDKLTGKVLNDCFDEMQGSLQEGLRPLEIDYIDLPFGDTTLKEVIKYHIDVVTKKIIIDNKIEYAETTEEKLKRLENEMLLNTNKNIEGGIF
ncbi:hypothetical protein G9F71_008210 [Clostridium sp. FP2]|uniref:hypothetical protein n=1 Tax=Clostridium sp. FP2 TaxID=2724481 RepID=UPI0013E95F10|nr:hypothetical protein [Clostridium sp. FP2]MBZ9622834.1 hypothetical protein [Clostridium sp. FP2]